MSSSENKQNKRSPLSLIALSLVAAAALGSSAYLYNQQQDLEQLAQRERADKEQALAQQRLAEGKWQETSLRLDAAQLENVSLQANMADLDAKLRATDARAAQLENAAGRNAAQAKELADLRATAQRLRDELAQSKEKELDLRAGIDRAKAEREALALQMGQRDAVVRMVNNAEVDALRGRKGRLTVKARSTKEVVMAFDLPENLATAAHFKVTGPDGKQYTGSDPALSVSHDRSDATASGGKGTGMRSSRVTLRCKPTGKLKAGVYKIDVSSGNDYLQTVYLSLR